MDEEEQEEEKPTTENTGGRDKPATTPIIDKANEAAERMEKATAKMDEALTRQEQIIAFNKLGGTTEAGLMPDTPKVLSDTEYAEALQRGEVNPLKEDGIFK